MPLGKTYYVYIVTNKPQGTLYIGITSDLIARTSQHKQKIIDGFTQKYNWLKKPTLNGATSSKILLDPPVKPEDDNIILILCHIKILGISPLWWI